MRRSGWERVAASVVLAVLLPAVPATADPHPSYPSTVFRTVVADHFDRSSGPLGVAATGQTWRRINDLWSVTTAHRAAAHVTPVSRFGYAVVNTRVSKNYVVGADVTLSPTPLRAAPGIVANFVDRKNYLFAKVEVTVAHPYSFLALGDQRAGVVHSTLCRDSHLGMVNGGTYRLSLRRKGYTAIAVVATMTGQRLGSCSVVLSPTQRAAYGSGTRFGLRVKIVSDEDDGRSRWDNFLVRAAA